MSGCDLTESIRLAKAYEMMWYGATEKISEPAILIF